MQSTENTPSARPELDQLIRDLYCDDGYALNRLRSQHAAVALAAERDRADRAEADLADARVALRNWQAIDKELKLPRPQIGSRLNSNEATA